MQGENPVVIDPTGAHLQEEGARIRANGPVSKVELPGGVEAWSVTGHAAACQALSDRRLSKDGRQHWTDFAEGRVGADFPLIGWVLMDNLTTSYGSDHTRLRKPCANAFTPRRVEALRPTVERYAAALLDELAAGPGEPVDLKAAYAHPLPSRVICELFGVPEEQRLDMLQGGEVNADTTITPEESAANVEKWHQLMLDFVEDKRRHPGDDLTSDLIRAEHEGAGLTPSEMVGTLHIMLATGTEPVKNLIANAVQLLLTHPEQRAAVLAGEVPWAQVIEETLRVEAPVGHLPFRFAVEDLEIDGVKIAKADPVLIHFAAIGRDPQVHGESAGTFDVTRENKEHLSFGQGIYRCIGRPLALLEAEIALTMLFERFPDLTLAVPPEQLGRQGTFIMNGVDTLPVRLSRDEVRA